MCTCFGSLTVSGLLFSSKGALLLFPPSSTPRGSFFSCKLAADGDDGAREIASSIMPELRELLAVLVSPEDE